MTTVYQQMRIWQKHKIGEDVFKKEQQHAQSLMNQEKPRLVVQIEGRSLLSQFPESTWYYHLSEDANRHSPGYSIEVEQGFIPFPDQSIQLLILGHALELYQSHQTLLAEIERVLAPSGVVMVSLLAKSWIVGKLPSSLHPLGGMVIHPISIRRLKRMIQPFGLEVRLEERLFSDGSEGFSTKRLAEQVIQPMVIELVRCSPEWVNTARVL